MHYGIYTIFTVHNFVMDWKLPYFNNVILLYIQFFYIHFIHFIRVEFYNNHAVQK